MNEGNTHEVSEVVIDLTLLAEARRLLEQSGFTVVDTELSSARWPWLLAENGLFALGVAAAQTLDDLVTLESYATPILADRIRGAGPKRWDAYLVLLAREDREARGTRAVRSLQYDTKVLRRILSLGVHTDEESVRRALRLFLPLPGPSAQALASAFDALVEELVLQGINSGQAREAVRNYQEQASNFDES